MSDLISRKAAIDALNGEISVSGNLNAIAVQNYIRLVSQRLHDLPSAQPGQNIAHKINLHHYPAAWICSSCGSKHFDFSDKYCSYCGADVRESKDE